MEITKRTNLNFLSNKNKSYNFKVEPDKQTLVKNLENEYQNKEIGFYGRIVTYEGFPDMSNEETVYSSSIQKDLKTSIQAIKNHLSQQDINLLSAHFYFKYDKKGELYFLFATNIKCETPDVNIANEREVIMTIPEDANLFDNEDSKTKGSSIPRPIGPKDIRVRPISAKPEKSYRSLVSQNRLKHFCPLCEDRISYND